MYRAGFVESMKGQKRDKAEAVPRSARGYCLQARGSGLILEQVVFRLNQPRPHKSSLREELGKGEG